MDGVINGKCGRVAMNKRWFWMESWWGKLLGKFVLLTLLLLVAWILFSNYKEEDRKRKGRVITDQEMIQKIKFLESDVRDLENKLEEIGKILTPDRTGT